MNEEDYLKKVRKALWKIDKQKRDEIVLELRSEIKERLDAGESLDTILKDLPSPTDIKREYENIYGPSTAIKLAFSITAIIISIFTVSVIPFTQTLFYGAPAFLILLAFILFYISSNFGLKQGLITSSISGILRFIIIYLTSMYVVLQNGTLITEGITSIIIFIIPFFRKK